MAIGRMYDGHACVMLVFCSDNGCNVQSIFFVCNELVFYICQAAQGGSVGAGPVGAPCTHIGFLRLSGISHHTTPVAKRGLAAC